MPPNQIVKRSENTWYGRRCNKCGKIINSESDLLTSKHFDIRRVHPLPPLTVLGWNWILEIWYWMQRERRNIPHSPHIQSQKGSEDSFVHKYQNALISLLFKGVPFFPEGKYYWPGFCLGAEDWRQLKSAWQSWGIKVVIWWTHCECGGEFWRAAVSAVTTQPLSSTLLTPFNYF